MNFQTMTLYKTPAASSLLPLFFYVCYSERNARGVAQIFDKRGKKKAAVLRSAGYRKKI